MRVIILGSEGYIGWALTNYLVNKGHEVHGLDDNSRRIRVEEIGSNSLVPKQDHSVDICESFRPWALESVDPDLLTSWFEEVDPDAIVHLAEQPSAPWSMIDYRHAELTQVGNVAGTLNVLWAMRKACPNAHLVKLGTMGEYGTPDCDIPEGTIPDNCLGNALFNWCDAEGREGSSPIQCTMAGLPFPKSPGSFYHLSKVHDTNNIIFACKVWGLTSTDIMQGVVFGNEYNTRFDYDEYFGTAINRFCAQAIIGHPLTVYGRGNQTRGFLPLKDSLQCLEIAINNSPKKGEYRVFNQFENIYTINELADMVRNAAISLGMFTVVDHIPNPRVEMEDHYYNPVHQKLFDLGYKPTTDIEGEITRLLMKLRPYKDRIIKEVILPKTTWR